MHAYDSQYVRDQLERRITFVNEVRTRPDGEFVLYWMQACDRLEDNWALRYATLEADRLGKPLLIHHGLGPSDLLASDRTHTFIIEGAQELAARAAKLGYSYRFWLRRSERDPGGVIDRLAERASLIVTDECPTAGVDARTNRLAARVMCRVVRVESWCIVPAALFAKEEYAARTIRPKLAKLRDHALEPVHDRPPKKVASATLIDSLDIDYFDVKTCNIAATVAACDIDHSVVAVKTHGGYTAARTRLRAFVRGALHDYETRRQEASDNEGTSRLSPYLHFGHISAAEVARTVMKECTSIDIDVDGFLDQLITWRELSYNFCLRNRHFDKLRALPDWVQRNMAKHTQDARPLTYTRTVLERGETGNALWNAAQHELVQSGVIHNVMRMLWGKSVILWKSTYGAALQDLLYLNNKYALDGFSPASYANILWCFGKFDRPFAERPIWGTIRPMSLERARAKFDVDAYIREWESNRLL